MRFVVSSTLALTLCLSPAARADSSCPHDGWDSCTVFDGKGVEIAFASFYAPELDVGSTKLEGAGLNIGASYRVKRLSAGVEYGALFASAANGESAGMHRVGAVARYLTQSPPASRMRRRGLFFETGAGLQFLSWDSGSLSRADLMLGVGAHTTLAIGNHYVGMYVGLRALITKTPAISCEPSRPVASFLASFGGMFHFGGGGRR